MSVIKTQFRNILMWDLKLLQNNTKIIVDEVCIVENPYWT